MRLDFNVLWLEDQPNRIAAQISSIRRRMQEHGFEFNATVFEKIADVRARLADDVFTDEVDLVMVDWDLGGNTQGQDAIGEIREHILYKDVVFYSALKTADELRRLAFERRIEGIYCVTRAELVDEVVGVFESLVKKVLDLDHVRGIVMGATSDIDHMVAECLGHIHNTHDAPGKLGMLKQAIERVEENLKDRLAKVDELRKATTFTNVLSEHMLFTASDRLRMLSRALEEAKFSAHKGFCPAVKDYLKEVVPDRNRLGHQVLAPAGKAKLVADNNTGKPITVEETRELRRVLLDLRSKFRDLRDALTPRN